VAGVDFGELCFFTTRIFC